MHSKKSVIHLVEHHFVIDDFYYFFHDVVCLNEYIIYKIYNNKTKHFKHLSKQFFIKNITDKLINQKTNNQRIFFFKNINIFFNKQIAIRTSLNASEEKAILWRLQDRKIKIFETQKKVFDENEWKWKKTSQKESTNKIKMLCLNMSKENWL